MIAFLIASSLALSGPQPDVKAFQNAFALRHSETASAKLDPGVAKAMDILIEKVRRDTSGNTTAEEMERMLNPYSRAVSTEEVFPTTYASISASVSRGMGKVAIGVRMGAVSRLRVFSATGKPVAVPQAFDWQYRYDMTPFMISGGKIVIDSPGIQDAGVRYGYRVSVLTPGAKGYTLAKQFSGAWVLSDEGEGHLGLDGASLKLSTVDDPKSFITASADTYFKTISTYDLGGPLPRLVKTNKEDMAFRAVDAWMAKAMKSPLTAEEKAFQQAYGKERQMYESIAVVTDPNTPADSAYVLRFNDTKFVFHVKSEKGSYKVLSFNVEP